MYYVLEGSRNDWKKGDLKKRNGPALSLSIRSYIIYIRVDFGRANRKLFALC
jgi:hypothetical protein